MQPIRYIVVLVSGFIAGSRAVDAFHSWREWHSWAIRDPSAADVYRTSFMVEAAIALVSLLIAGLVWWLLRPHSRRKI